MRKGRKRFLTKSGPLLRRRSLRNFAWNRLVFFEWKTRSFSKRPFDKRAPFNREVRTSNLELLALRQTSDQNFSVSERIHWKAPNNVPRSQSDRPIEGEEEC